ncbi:MAG: methyltransferase [Acidimicrobiales bacterium]|nr:MAG: methyltransferase [Acidimicrobiales bacterium]
MVQPRPTRRARSASPNRPLTHGAHYLTGWAVRRVLDVIPTQSTELIVDLGAGLGALTTPLAQRGSRVIAVEQRAGTAIALRRRVEPYGVTVVQRDIRDFRWPSTPFRIVANPPFGLSIWLLRELTQHRPAALYDARLLLQRGFIQQLTAPARNSRTARWQQAAEFTELLRLPPDAFVPPPRVGASLLRLQPRRRARS